MTSFNRHHNRVGEMATVVELAPQAAAADVLSSSDHHGEEIKEKPHVAFSGVSADQRVGPAATSASLMAPVKPLTLRIYTIDNRPHEICFRTGKHTTAGQIVDAMMGQLSLPADLGNVFSVWMTSPYLQLQLKSYHTPVKLFKKWKEMLIQYTNYSHDVCSADEPILSFRRNAFLPLKDEKKLIAKRNSRLAITLLYHEAVHNVINGRYPLSHDELIELSGLQCAAEKGQYNTELHTIDTLRPQLRRFLPPHMCSTSGGEKKKKLVGSASKGPVVEAEMLSAYRKAWEKCSQATDKKRKTSVESSAVAASLGQEEEDKLWADTELQLQLLYLQRCWCKSFYGCVMFRGQVERKRTSNLKQLLLYSDRNVVVALNPECVHLFTDSSPREIMLFLTYDQLSWDFEPATEEGENFYSSLWLEYDSIQGTQKVAKRLQIFSRQAPMMDAMISRCVGELNKHDEELKQQRRQKGEPETLPPVLIKTEHALPTQQNYLEHKLCCEVTTDAAAPGSPPAASFLSKMRRKKSSDAVQSVSGEDTHPLAAADNTRLEKSPHV